MVYTSFPITHSVQRWTEWERDNIDSHSYLIHKGKVTWWNGLIPFHSKNFEAWNIHDLNKQIEEYTSDPQEYWCEFK